MKVPTLPSYYGKHLMRCGIKLVCHVDQSDLHDLSCSIEYCGTHSLIATQ
jgi:hypothetical protein